MSASPEPRLSRSPRLRKLLAALPAIPLFLPLFFPVPGRAEDFTIRAFRADIEIGADASLRVTETIDVEFDRPRHGIYREIPFRTVDELGKKWVTPIRVVSVADPSGKGWRYKTERAGDLLRIRIGDPNRFVEGRQTYAIAYTVGNGVLFFPDHDELYWNVTGNDWPVPIGSATAVATVAAGSRSLDIRTRAYTGPRGSRESACSIVPARNGATFVSTRPFRPGEGMTIVVGWEKGVVRPPPSFDAALFELDLRKNGVFLAPLLTLMYMTGLWYRKGKDPPATTPRVVEYAPPEEGGRPLLPAEMGVLLDERLDPRDISASIVHLAVKGYLAIEERKSPGLLFDKTGYVLRKVKPPGGELAPFERMLMERLFQEHDPAVSVADLRQEFYRNIEDLKKAAFEGMERFKLFGANPLTITKKYRNKGFLVFLAGGGIALVLSKTGLLDGTASVAAAFLSGVVVFLFAPFLPAKTAKGVKVLGTIRGFEEFLLRAEKDRLERMNDPRLFERHLPYAIALGVSDRWARAFEGIVQEPPGWYVSQEGGGSFRPASFHHCLESALSSLSSAMHSAPRSGGSGFSGGGGSGGGGGGGGGGSW